jgi:PhzF family phenazine biosynthesis protein
MKPFEKVVGGTGVTIFGKSTKENSFIEVRSLTPSHNIEEDPVCGSGNGAVCAFMLENNIVNRDTNYVASQGAAIGRGGKIYGRIDKDGKIFIGGKCVMGIIGETEF